MSLALYLQMVGRGLRPKPDGGDCIILDLAANAVTHGLPEDYRDWSLEPRGTKRAGEAPVVICPLCETASPAASQHCRGCGYSFGKDCERCGRWRAHKRWIYEKHCGDAHQLVCDLCHIDAHIQAHLPVMPPLDQLVNLSVPEYEMTFPNDIEINDDLANRLSALLRELLESERQSIAGADDARREELRQLIERRELVLNEDAQQIELFQEHIAALPEEERPGNLIQQGLMIAEWVNGLRSELVDWQSELVELDNREVDKQGIFNSARNKALRLLMRAAEGAGLLPDLQNVSQAIDIPPHSINDENGPNDDGQSGQVSNANPRRFYIESKRNGIAAQCDVYNAKKIIILAGSTANKRENAGYPSYEKQKQRLIADGVLIDSGQHYRFAKDHEVTSPSAAGAMVLASSVNGRLNLKDANGIPFDKYYPK